MHKSCCSLSFLATLAQTPDLDYGHKEATYCFSLRSKGWRRFYSFAGIPFFYGFHLLNENIFGGIKTFIMHYRNIENTRQNTFSNKDVFSCFHNVGKNIFISFHTDYTYISNMYTQSVRRSRSFIFARENKQTVCRC